MHLLPVLAIDALILCAIPALYSGLLRVAERRDGIALATIPVGLLILAVTLIAIGYTHLRIDF